MDIGENSNMITLIDDMKIHEATDIFTKYFACIGYAFPSMVAINFYFACFIALILFFLSLFILNFNKFNICSIKI